MNIISSVPMLGDFLEHISSVFTGLSKTAFKPLTPSLVDLLVQSNYITLHPCLTNYWYQKQDRKVLKSTHGLGWLIVEGYVNQFSKLSLNKVSIHPQMDLSFF